MSDKNRPAVKGLRIVFDGPPSHESGRFVEAEDESGRSVNCGDWIEMDGGLHALVIDPACVDTARQAAEYIRATVRTIRALRIGEMSLSAIEMIADGIERGEHTQ